MNYPEIVKIVKIKEEAKDVKTFRFRSNRSTKPGQFFMVWIPGIDEIPMSVSYLGNLKGITVENVGEATIALYQMKVDDKLGIRGPYGEGYKILGKKLLFVAGGTGIISLASAIEYAKKAGKIVVLTLGAKSKKDLIFLKRIKKSGANLLICTDDGSFGKKALTSELAAQVLEKEKFSSIITCGPEKMLKKILELGIKYKTPVQASLERFMKCGLGICDSCAINGLHVCKDGPVFNDKVLIRMEEFGKWKRDVCGRRVEL